MFEKYLELGSVLKVVEYLNTHGYRTKEYISHRKNTTRGGSRLFNQYISHVLKAGFISGRSATMTRSIPDSIKV